MDKALPFRMAAIVFDGYAIIPPLTALLASLSVCAWARHINSAFQKLPAEAYPCPSVNGRKVARLHLKSSIRARVQPPFLRARVWTRPSPAEGERFLFEKKVKRDISHPLLISQQLHSLVGIDNSPFAPTRNHLKRPDRSRCRAFGYAHALWDGIPSRPPRCLCVTGPRAVVAVQAGKSRPPSIAIASSEPLSPPIDLQSLVLVKILPTGMCAPVAIPGASQASSLATLLRPCSLQHLCTHASLE